MLIVSFKTRFPPEGSPPGRQLADFIVQSLEDASIKPLALSEREGWAWTISAQDGQVRIESIIGYIDDGPRQWLITNAARVPLLSKIWKGRTTAEQKEAALRQYCEALHRAIKNDPRFHTIRWYAQESFDSDHGDTWGEAP